MGSVGNSGPGLKGTALVFLSPSHPPTGHRLEVTSHLRQICQSSWGKGPVAPGAASSSAARRTELRLEDRAAAGFPPQLHSQAAQCPLPRACGGH